MRNRRWAWGQDEVRPVAREGLQWLRLGLTIIDSLVRSSQGHLLKDP